MEADLVHLLPRTYALQGLQNVRNRDNALQTLLQQQRLPKDPTDDQTIEYFLQQFALMDSNNFQDQAGVGEREGRVFSSLVAKRHFHFSHGIGRSGDIAEVQPKAAGSSVVYKLTNKMAAHALSLAGMKTEFKCIVFPLATGMTLALTFLALKAANAGKKYLIWSRIDQKSCFKSMLLADLIPIIVDPILSPTDGSMHTDVATIQQHLDGSEYAGNILAVLTTTSCFAPRQPDQIDQVAELCKTYNVAHVINNAYGLQCAKICKLIDRAHVKGRVDAVIQSTDKNFMVPVGGAILASTSDALLQRVSASYPGRASITPILDLFITLLSMGQSGYLRLLEQRQRLTPIVHAQLTSFCYEEGFGWVIPSTDNTISYAVSLTELPAHARDLSFLGAMLFQRNISGCRVVVCSHKQSKIAGYDFVDWGAHVTNYSDSYFTVACALGMQEEEIDLFFNRLRKTIRKYRKLNELMATEPPVVVEAQESEENNDDSEVGQASAAAK